MTNIDVPQHGNKISGLERPATLAFGDSAESKRWRHATFTLAQILGELSKSKTSDRKDGRCFLQGRLVKGGPRSDWLMRTIELIGYDVDNGQHYTDIAIRAQKAGIECWIYPTYNCDSPETRIKSDHIHAWAKIERGQRVTADQVLRFLREKRGFEDWVLDDATVQRDGFEYVIRHRPLPRYRAIAPLGNPIDFPTLGDTLKEAKDCWSGTVKGVARILGIRHHDASCEDPSRLFYTHRRPPGAEDWFIRIEGALLDPSPFIEHAKTNAAADGKQDTDYKTPGLARWFATRGNGFKAADFLEAHGADAKRKDAGKVEAACPFEHEHSDGGDGRRVLCGINAGASQNGHPSISCRHATCQERKTTHFVDAILQQRELGVEALGQFTDTPAPGAETEFSDILETNKREVVIGKLARLSPIDYDRIRQKAKDKLGVRQSTLDAEVVRRRAELQKEQEAEADDPLAEVTPWPEPVDGEAILTETLIALHRHVVLPEHVDIATALFVVHTHCHGAATISPILTIQSPEKRSGKTTPMNLLQLLVPKPLSASNLTTAVLFRVIDAHRPTILLDEGDTFLDDNEELRGALNSSHNRHSAFVWRCVGDDHEPTRFSTWAPFAISRIGQLSDTLQDRAVVIALRRALPDETVARLRLDRTAAFAELRSKLARWAADHMDELRGADPALPATLNSRAADNWRCLVAIADQIGPMWGDLARKSAIALSETVQAAAEPGEHHLLLADCRQVFDGDVPLPVDLFSAPATAADAFGQVAGQRHEELTPNALVKGLLGVEDSDWNVCNRGRPITARYLSSLLKAYGIKTLKAGKGKRVYRRHYFEANWQRYLPPQAE